MRLEALVAQEDRQQLFEAELVAATAGGHLRAHTGLGSEAERRVRALAFAAPDREPMLLARARRAFATAEAFAARVNHDRSLHYEVAVGILSALIARCTTSVWHEEHQAKPDSTVIERYHELRQAYWSMLVDLEPTDPAAVAAVLRTDGAQLARLRAADSEPVAPISDTYRLHPADHAAIFDHRIVPEILAGFGAGEANVAIIVTGAPGSGTTRLRRELHDHWTGQHGCIAIGSDILAGFHPHEWHRGVDDNQLLADAVAADVQQWMIMAVRRILANHNDVVLEVPDGESSAVDELATVFRTAGYRVEMRRTPDSPLIAERHHAIRRRWCGERGLGVLV